MRVAVDLGVDQAAHGLADGDGADGSAHGRGEGRPGGELVALGTAECPPGSVRIVGGAGEGVALGEKFGGDGRGGGVLGDGGAVTVTEQQQGPVPVGRDVGHPGRAVGERAGAMGGCGCGGLGGGHLGAGGQGEDGAAEDEAVDRTLGQEALGHDGLLPVEWEGTGGMDAAAVWAGGVGEAGTR